MRAGKPSITARCADTLLSTWITTGRIVVITAGIAFALYLTLRPFLPSPSTTATPTSSWLTIIQSWPTLLANTLTVAGTATLISLSLAIPLSFLLFRTDLPARRLITAALLFLACLPVFATASAVLSVFGIQPSRGNAWVAGLIHGWIGTPLALLQIGLGYRSINGDIVEAASLDASRRRIWAHIDWPHIRWSVGAVLLIQLWIAGTDVTVSDLLSVRTFTEEVYITYQLSGSAAMQSLQIAPYLILFGLLVMAIRRTMTVSHVTPMARRPPPVALKHLRAPVAVAVAITLLGMVAVPVTALARQIESWPDFIRISQTLVNELCASIFLSGGVGVVTVALTMSVMMLAVSAGRAGRLLRLSLLILFVLPTPCLAIGLIEGLNRPGPPGLIYDSPAALVIGQTLRWLPLAVLITVPALLRISGDAVDAARVDGCDGACLHRELYWPLSSRFLALAFAAVIILVLGEVTTCVLLQPPGFLPLSVRFFTLVHYGLRNEAAVICWLMVIVLLIPWSILTYFLHRAD